MTYNRVFLQALIKVLIGQRRVGKSYILRQIMNYLVEEIRIEPRNIFYLNNEYLVFDDMRFDDFEGIIHINPWELK